MFLVTTPLTSESGRIVKREKLNCDLVAREASAGIWSCDALRSCLN